MICDKTCPKCGETKPVSEFHPDKTKSSGIKSRCKKCVNEISSIYYAVNRKTISVRNRINYTKNREKILDNGRSYYAENRENILKQKSAYLKANPELHRIQIQNRRAKQRASGGKLSKGLADRLFSLQRGKCACGCKQPLGTDYHLDHIMPLALGGSNTDGNIQLLRSKCNHQKSSKHPVDFMRQRGFLL